MLDRCRDHRAGALPRRVHAIDDALDDLTGLVTTRLVVDASGVAQLLTHPPHRQVLDRTRNPVRLLQHALVVVGDARVAEEFRVCATPGVERLVRVADHDQRARHVTPHPEQLELEGAHVLRLVRDDDVRIERRLELEVERDLDQVREVVDVDAALPLLPLLGELRDAGWPEASVHTPLAEQVVLRDHLVAERLTGRLRGEVVLVGRRGDAVAHGPVGVALVPRHQRLAHRHLRPVEQAEAVGVDRSDRLSGDRQLPARRLPRRRLTESTYARIMDTLHLGDQRKPEQQIDSILRIRPDMVIIAGGTDGGASRSVQKLLEPIGLASYLMPEEKRPAVLYAGNDKLADEIKTLVGSLASTLHFSPNIRPSLETEDIDPAELELAQMTMTIRKKQLKGLDVLDLWAGGHTLPTAYATGRMVRFLSKVYGSPKGLLSVDLGSSSAVIAAGFQNKSVLKTFPHFGLGENITSLLNYTTIDDILRWSSLDIPPSVIQNYLYQKALHPATIAATPEDLALAQAVATQSLFLAMQATQSDFPKDAAYIKQTLTPLFDPIIAGGSVLSDVSSPGRSLLLLLNSVQPVGISTVILDQNNLMPMLGAAASQNSILPVQVIESGAFLSVGTVIAPVVSARYGQSILKAKITYSTGAESVVDLKYGFLETVPLATGEAARITIQVGRGVNIGFGSGRGVKNMSIAGGTLGIIFDGRGRPLDLPGDPVRRRELIKKWNWALGGG